MNKKEIFEQTMAEPVEEEGITLRTHILEILEPFKEIAQLEWATGEIIIACDDLLDEFRPAMHTEDCRNGMGPTWKCICNFNK